MSDASCSRFWQVDTHSSADVIMSTRKEYLRRAHSKVSRMYLKLTRHQSNVKMRLMEAINEDLQMSQMAYDLTDDLPADFYKRHSPGKLLGQVESTIQSLQSRPQSLPLSDGQESIYSESRSLNSSSSGRRRGTGHKEAARESVAADILPEITKLARNALARRFKRSKKDIVTTPPVPERTSKNDQAELDKLGAELIIQIHDFIRDELRPLDIDEFASLRAQHVMPFVS